MPTKGRLHWKQAEASDPSFLVRRVPRPRARLSPDGCLREGDRQAKGLGRAPIRGSQGLARLAPVPPSQTLEGKYRGPADRDWPEPETATPEAGLGTPTMAEW